MNSGLHRIGRIAALVAAALSVAGVQEDADIARWIDDLAHEEVARREEAQRSLLKAGARALPALVRVRDSKDAEKATRVGALIAEIERPEKERLHDARMRPLALQLVTLQIANGKLSDVLEALEKQLKIRFRVPQLPEMRISIDAREMPLRECLDLIEDRLGITFRDGTEDDAGRVFDIIQGRFLRKPRAYLPGATLEFSTRPVKVAGTVKAVRLAVEVKGGSVPELGPWEVRGADGTAKKLETCNRCGPYLALVSAGEGEELHIRVKGSVLWDSPYDLEVADPAERQTFRIGPYTLGYEFPSVTIQTETPMAALRFGTARFEGRRKEGIGSRRWFPGPGPGPDEKNSAVWCDCPKNLKPGLIQPLPLLTMRVETPDEFRLYSASDFESMRIRFYKRVAEPCEAEAVIPAH